MHTEKEKWHLPHLGQRIVKTTVAVFICLLIYYFLRGFGRNMVAEAAITAIICMQPFVRDTRDYVINRLVGTTLGVLWGLLFLLLLYAFPPLANYRLIYYLLMAGGVLLSLYSAVLVRKPDVSSLTAIVFLAIVIASPDIDDPLAHAASRMLAVFIGTVVAVVVNAFRLPRTRHPERVFFVRTRDLAPDRFSHVPPAALYRLNYLYNDGAKICLMLEHAPAFFVLQMSEAKLNVPLIVMDGAAIFDANENQFVQMETIDPSDTKRLEERLRELDISYFIYTIHRNKTCIFHRGELREEEKVIYDRMRRSPYRSYLDREIYDPEEIVYLKVIAKEEEIASVEGRLRDAVGAGTLRAVCRPQAGAPGIAALYIYSAKATMEQARDRLMELLKKEEPSLVPVTLRARNPYQSERDAIHLLHQLEKSYAPVKWIGERKEKKQAKES